MTIPNDQEAIKPPAADKMLPCPFCVSENVFGVWLRTGQSVVICEDCNSFGAACDDEKQAIKAWNKRAVQTNHQDLSDCIFDPSFRVLGFSFAVLNELRRQLMLRMCDMEPVTVDGVKKALAIDAWNRRA